MNIFEVLSNQLFGYVIRKINDSNNFLFLIEKVVTPNQKKYPWYHQNFRRVPTIDECYESDVICRWEAQKQFERDKYISKIKCLNKCLKTIFLHY